MHDKLIILSFLFVLSMASCVPLKRSIYLQGEIATKIKDLNNTTDNDLTEYTVKPNDNLYIYINSLDDRTSSFLNNESGFTTRIDNPMAASLVGYKVDQSGNIQFPIAGTVKVSGLTINQVRDRIKNVVSNYIDESIVTVKLLNDNVTILGEVKKPGRYLLYDEKINILEAISLAGDVTDFANKKKVRLIRKNDNPEEMIILNTLDDQLIFSKYYNIEPGDIIYVEPRRLKSVQLSSIPVTLVLTLINTTLLLYTFYNTNIIQNN